MASFPCREQVQQALHSLRSTAHGMLRVARTASLSADSQLSPTRFLLQGYTALLHGMQLAAALPAGAADKTVQVRTKRSRQKSAQQRLSRQRGMLTQPPMTLSTPTTSPPRGWRRPRKTSRTASGPPRTRCWPRQPRGCRPSYRPRLPPPSTATAAVPVPLTERPLLELRQAPVPSSLPMAATAALSAAAPMRAAGIAPPPVRSATAEETLPLPPRMSEPLASPVAAVATVQEIPAMRREGAVPPQTPPLSCSWASISALWCAPSSGDHYLH